MYPADRGVADAGRSRRAAGVLIWDAPVRVFHWLMVLSFAGAYLTAESERWRLVHVTLGYTMAGLVAFRIVWGFVGTRHARFTDFVRGPAAVVGYLRRLAQGSDEPQAGHNPAGAVAIMALLSLTLIVTAAGWASFNDIGGEWAKELHEVIAEGMLAVVGLHVLGVLVGSWMHRQNLIGAMLSGRKKVDPKQGVHSAWRSVAVLMVVAVLGFWALEWQAASAFGPVAAALPVTGAQEPRDD
jgi:cytochrome b